ncbi:hypothetical protein EON65_49375 [archaeon]|nr:MAG: hypothetical protein EON65_49375 [archaeon]
MGKILGQDMGPENARLDRQRKTLPMGEALIHSLPIDTATSGKPVLEPQLMICEGLNENQWLKTIRNSCFGDKQEATFLVASAASGCGKTNGAYAVGKIYSGENTILSIVIRVAEPYNGIGGSPSLSKPFDYLDSLLDAHMRQCNQIQQCSELLIQQCSELLPDQKSQALRSIANNALKLIKLWLATYVKVTLDAIDAAPDATREVQQELCLRFHRNGVAEDIIKREFQQLVNDYLEKDSTNQHVTGQIVKLDDDKINQLLEDIDFRALPFTIFLCIDEAQILLNKCSGLFFTKVQYEQTDIDTLQPSTDLFYGVCVALCGFNQKYKWTVYLTGTAFSMVHFRKTSDDYSPLRGSTVAIRPTTTFTRQQMQSILSYYWRWEDGTFQDEEVIQCLNLCAGRPLIFVRVIFHPLYCSLFDRPLLTELSKQHLIECVQSHAEKMSFTIYQMMQGLIDRHIRILPIDETRTSRSFLPHLVKALMFEDGKLDICRSDHFEEAISSGLIPLVAKDDQEDETFCLFDEPLARRGLQRALDEELLSSARGRGLLHVMRSLIEIEHESKGTVAERAFAYDLALRSYVHKLKYLSKRGNAAASYQGIPLSELLSPLFPSDNMLLMPDLASYYCRVDKATQWRANEDATRPCALRVFEQAGLSLAANSAKLNEDIIVYDLPVEMGANLAFVVWSPADATQKLVIAQSKNKKDGTLAEAVVTLHPGTQYLTNFQRNSLLTSQRKSRSFMHVTTGAGSTAWKDYVQFCRSYPGIVDNWIRIALVGREVKAKVLQFVKSAESRDRSFLDKHLRKIAPNSKQANGLRDSPLLLLSFASDSFLDAPMRALFVDRSESILSLPRISIRWDAVSVDEMLKHGLKQGVTM